jgi:hypothetical protein
LDAFVKNIRPLCAQRFDTIHQLLMIVESLYSQPVLQAGNAVVVARNEIRAVRKAVKQLPDHMLQ